MAPLALPTPVLQFIEAINNNDSQSLAAVFEEDGILVNEGQQYKTHTAIEAWATKDLVSHKATVKVLNAQTTQDGKTVVDITLDGDYAAAYGITEPFPLHLYFTHSNKAIQHVRITDIPPTQPTMRAVWASGASIEDPLSTLRNDIRPIPTVPEGWVRVKVSAAAINFHDIFTLRGQSMFPLTFPLTLGNEAVGTLDDGTDVVIFPVMGDSAWTGDRTVDPKRHVLGELTQGALAEYVVVPRENVLPKPKELSTQSAAVLGIAWLTAYRMLFVKSGLQKGQTMLVQGAAGGVSTALIQLGHAAGMTVWCTGRTAEKRRQAERLGASRTFAPGEELPEKVNAVFETSGAASWDHSMASVGLGGRIVVCGLHAGGKVELDLMKLFTESLMVVGSYAGTLDDMKGLIKFVADKKIDVHVSEVLPLDRVEEGLKKIRNGEATGKIVIAL